jgi:hypothetical protein
MIRKQILFIIQFLSIVKQTKTNQKRRKLSRHLLKNKQWNRISILKTKYNKNDNCIKSIYFTFF